MTYAYPNDPQKWALLCASLALLAFAIMRACSRATKDRRKK